MALDVVWTMILDRMAGAEPRVRSEYEENLVYEWDAPLDPAEREHYDRENWGFSEEAQRHKAARLATVERLEGRTA